MKKIEAIYPEAVERTKEKIHDDLIHYLATKENIPTLENYLIDRKHYLDQIWINIWITKPQVKFLVAKKNSFYMQKVMKLKELIKK